MSNVTYHSLYVSAKQDLIDVIRDNDLRDYDEAFDYVHEVADTNVPHYYTDIFSVFAEGGISHEMDDAGLIEGITDVTSILQMRIYEELSNDLLSDLEDLIEDYLNEEGEPEYWVLDANTKVFIKQGVPLNTAISFCKENYAIGRHFVVEDINNVVVYDPSVNCQDESQIEHLAVTGEIF